MGNMRYSSAYVCSHHPGMHRSHVNTCHTVSQRHLVHSDTVLPLCSCQIWSLPHCSYRARSRALCPTHNSQTVSQKRKNHGVSGLYTQWNVFQVAGKVFLGMAAHPCSWAHCMHVLGTLCACSLDREGTAQGGQTQG